MTDRDDKLLMKLTVTADETPELYQALQVVKDPRRRTRRLKDLATKGLMVERARGSLMGNDDATHSAEPATTVGRIAVHRDTVGTMLDWDGDPQ